MWGEEGMKAAMLKGLNVLLAVCLSPVSPLRPLVQVNFGPCAALVQQRALGVNPAQLGPSLALLSLPQ